MCNSPIKFQSVEDQVDTSLFFARTMRLMTSVEDVFKPLKMLLPDYALIEQRVEESLARQFCLQMPMPPEVKHADTQMLLLEKQQVMGNNDNWAWTEGYEVPELRILHMQPDRAMRAFLDRADELIWRRIVA